MLTETVDYLEEKKRKKKEEKSSIRLSKIEFLYSYGIYFNVVIGSCIKLHCSGTVNDPLYKYTVSYHIILALK